jgi:N-acetyl-gamma-glutamyl-phosphate reductase
MVAAPPQSGLLKVGVAGASGFTGGELLRILAGHPHVQLTLAAAGSQAGAAVSSLHPFLDGVVDLVTCDVATLVERSSELDCLFLALPHGESFGIVPKLTSPALKVIDLSGDYRLRDPSLYEQHYHRPHGDAAALPQFVYGLTELRRAEIATASRIANPGCFATAVTLALAPLVAAGLVTPIVHVSAVTGSTGSGAGVTPALHHSLRSDNFVAYKVFGHQHLPEIQQSLGLADPASSCRLVLQTHSAPLVRGIHATVFAELRSGARSEDVGAVFRETYASASFVRLREQPPNLKWVRGTNFTDLSWHVDGTSVIVLAAIDNLIKGAAGQAVQNMNVAFGLPETAGLKAMIGGGL